MEDGFCFEKFFGKLGFCCLYLRARTCCIMRYSEEEIRHALEQGDEACLNMLYDNYYKALCKYAFRVVLDVADAEDVVQEVFVSFWMNKKRQEFKGSVQAYLFGAVMKAASKFVTRRQRVVFDDVEQYADYFIDEKDGVDEEAYGELLTKVKARVEALPEKTREVFKAVVLKDMTYKQIGQLFHITENTVKTLYYRALKELRADLGGERFVMFLATTRERLSC